MIYLTSNLGTWELGQRAEIETIDTNHNTVGHGRSSCKHKIAHLGADLCLGSWAHSQFCVAWWAHGSSNESQELEFINSDEISRWAWISGDGVLVLTVSGSREVLIRWL